MIAKNVITLLNNVEKKEKQIRIRLIEKIEYADILSAVRYCNDLYIIVTTIDNDCSATCKELLNDIKDKFDNYENDNDTLIKNLDNDKVFFVTDIVEYDDIIEIFAKELTKGGIE